MTFRVLSSTVMTTWCAAFAAAFCSVTARGELRVVQPGGAPLPAGAATATLNPRTGGWDITLHQLYNAGGETIYEIRGSGGEVIDNLIIDIDGPPAGSPLNVKVLSDAPMSLRTVRNIVQTGSAETMLTKVNVTEDIGMVMVDTIGELICGRDMLGPIVSTTPDNATRGVTWAQAGRDILGDVKAQTGRIGLVWAQRNIGAPGAPVEIHAKHKITQVMAIDIHADINTRVDGGTGGLWAMVCERFFGTVTTEKLFFNTNNGLDSIVEIHQQFTGRFNIGKSHISPTATFLLPTQGLAGQIIVNYDAMAGGNWTSPVRLGPNGSPGQIVLVGPRYPQPNTVLGGGAIGLVPFRLHDQACTPANNQTIQAGVGVSPMIRLRHYGPVTWSPAGGLPVTVERRPAGSATSFTPLADAEFQASFDPLDPTVVTVAAAPGMPGFAGGWQYRIRPRTALRCDVPAVPAVVWDTDYFVTVQQGLCAGDVDGNGVVNVSDLLMIINFWGAVSPGFTAPDLNHDGWVNVDDLLQVINHWGSC